MKIYMITDLEGCAGVLNFDDWCVPQGRYYETGKRLLTLEVNAAIEGFFAGGADDVTVIDGHGPGGINPELLDARAILIRGPRQEGYFRIGPDYDAVAYVGQHAKSGTPYSHIPHTGTFAVLEKKLNGIPVGEYGDGAAMAYEAGIPLIFASGEEAFCREAEALTPGVVTVAVKRGLMDNNGYEKCSAEEYAKLNLGAEHLAPLKARAKIAAGAKLSMSKYYTAKESFRAIAIQPPYRLETRFRPSATTPERVFEAYDENSVSGLLNQRMKERTA